MTKSEYLKQLKKYLHRLPREDYENTMEYFEEYFEDIGDENVAQAIEELGTPKEAAAELLNQMLDTQLHTEKEQSGSLKKTLLLSGLCILAAPIGIPLFIVLLAVLFCVFVCIGCLFFTAGILLVSTVFVAGYIFLRGFISLTVSIPGALVLIGLALISLGIGIFLFYFICVFAKWISEKTILFISKISKKGGHSK